MQGKKPTYEQRKFLTSKGLDTYSWLIQKDCTKWMQLINRITNEVIKVDKSK